MGVRIAHELAGSFGIQFRAASSRSSREPKENEVINFQALARFICALAFAVSLANAGLAAQNPGTEPGGDAGEQQIGRAVDAYVEGQLRTQRVPGLALAVVRDGHLINARGYGLANIELDVRVKPETIFQTGSVGKQFTATAIMMLVEEGKIGLDDKISTYLPVTPAKWDEITVRNLLTHTSGIADYAAEANPKPGGVIDLRSDYTEDELLQKFMILPMNFKPGEEWSYSNTGYVLLGILIHKVTGEFYGDFLQERIFRPLGMNATRIISEAEIIPNRAAGYELVNGEIKNQKWVSPSLNTTADGALYTNVIDMAKWDAALYNEKLLKRKSFDQIWTPVKLLDGKTHPYGFGWDIGEANGHRLLEHGGAWQGFTTDISRYVDDRLTVVVLTNLDGDHSRPDRIAHGVADLYIPALIAARPKAIEDTAPLITALLRGTLADLAAGHLNLESFPVDQRKIWTAENISRLSEFWKGLGALKSMDLIERRQEGTLSIYKYFAEYPNQGVIVTLTLDADGKINALQIHPQ
jgi:CubicO group peptidase (beta-lactamase class C family)